MLRCLSANAQRDLDAKADISAARSRVWASIFECALEQAGQRVDNIRFTPSGGCRMPALLTACPTVAGVYDQSYRAAGSAANRQFVLEPALTEAESVETSTSVNNPNYVFTRLSLGGSADTMYTSPLPARFAAVDPTALELYRSVMAYVGSTCIVRLSGSPGDGWLAAEAKLVAGIATYLRWHYQAEHGGATEDEELDSREGAGFWRGRLAVITPHHAQRRAINERLVAM